MDGRKINIGRWWSLMVVDGRCWHASARQFGIATSFFSWRLLLFVPQAWHIEALRRDWVSSSARRIAAILVLSNKQRGPLQETYTSVKGLQLYRHSLRASGRDLAVAVRTALMLELKSKGPFRGRVTAVVRKSVRQKSTKGDSAFQQ